MNLDNWFDNLPQKWDAEKIRNITFYSPQSIPVEQLKNKKFYYYDIPHVQKFGVGRQEEGSNIDSNKFRLRGGEILISKLNPRKGTVVLTEGNELEIICSTEFVPLKASTVLNDKFLYYILSSKKVANYLNKFVKSVTRSHQRVNPQDILNMRIPVPGKDVQNKIVFYLDFKLSNLQKLILNKEHIIKLLEKQRQSIITEAVTKGLNPNVKMKDSGVEWIGEIPEHWTVNKIKRIVDILTCGYASTPTYVDESEGVPFLSAQNVSKSGKLKLEKYNFISQELHASLTKYKKPRRGDILQVRVGAGIGQTCIVDVDFDFSIYVSLSHIRVQKFINNKYLTYILGSQKFNEYTNMQTLQAGGVGNLNVSDLEKSKIPYPSLDEQIEIANYLEAECSKIDSLINNIKKQIDKLKEYRQALIYEAVTGKIDVRDMELD